MAKASLRKVKWTLSFDPQLKEFIIKEAHRKGIYPVNLIEEIIRERFNLYGHVDIKDSVEYVQSLRKTSRDKTDEAFLKEIYEWQRSNC
jgi:hypothetical protein